MYTKVVTKMFIYWLLMLLFILQSVLRPSGFHGYSTSGQADAWLSPPAEYESKCEGTVHLDISYYYFCQLHPSHNHTSANFTFVCLYC